MNGIVTAVSRSRTHTFSKEPTARIQLLRGLGVESDAHSGAIVKHRSRVAVDPNQPNLRQVHLIHEELFGELRNLGFTVSAGDLGENITTRGVDLLALPRGTRLQIGSSAIVVITGLRNPCVQLDRFQAGLMKAVLGHTDDGKLIRKAGVMGTVEVTGPVMLGNPISVTYPASPHEALKVV